MHDKDFKYKVVKALTEGKSQSSVGRDFHIPQTTVSSWLKDKDELIRWYEEKQSTEKTHQKKVLIVKSMTVVVSVWP